MDKLDLEKLEETEINCQHLLDHGKIKGIKKEKKNISTSASLAILKPFCGSQKIAENSQRDGNTRSPYSSPKKPMYGTRRNS